MNSLTPLERYALSEVKVLRGELQILSSSIDKTVEEQAVKNDMYFGCKLITERVERLIKLLEKRK